MKYWLFNRDPQNGLLTSLNGGFLKWWYPATMGFPTKNDHFVVFGGYHYLRKHPNNWVVFHPQKKTKQPGGLQRSLYDTKPKTRHQH